MKSFKQYLKETKGKPSYKIYCDMDGVLVDFMRGIMESLHISREPNQDEIAEFLATLEGSSVDWWSGLEWQPGGKKLWGLLSQLNTEILTACPSQCKMQPSVKKGKKKWCKEKLKITQGVNVTTRRGKVRFSAPTHILIDDYIKNVNEWKAAGGLAIHHRDPRRTAKELKDIILG
jgi:hypothetical protein